MSFPSFPLFPQGHSQLMIGLFICCHLIGMSSACINPILYGYLNESFRAQFVEIVAVCFCGYLETTAATGNNTKTAAAQEAKKTPVKKIEAAAAAPPASEFQLVVEKMADDEAVMVNIHKAPALAAAAAPENQSFI